MFPVDGPLGVVKWGKNVISFWDYHKLYFLCTWEVKKRCSIIEALKVRKNKRHKYRWGTNGLLKHFVEDMRAFLYFSLNDVFGKGSIRSKEISISLWVKFFLKAQYYFYPFLFLCNHFNHWWDSVNHCKLQ